MKKFLLACSILISSVASAQTFSVGQVTPTYTSPYNPLTTLPPAYNYMEPDVPTTGVTVNGWINGTGGQYDSPAELPVGQAKARFDCQDSQTGNFDFILTKGLPTSPHLHEFFGRVNLDYTRDTYAELRESGGRSTCFGGAFNLTPYWHPAWMQNKGGLIVAKRTRNIVTYYQGGSLSDNSSVSITNPDNGKPWPRGIAYINGFSIADAEANIRDNDYEKDIIDAANASGHNLNYPSNGFNGYSCNNKIGDGSTPYSPNPGQNNQPYLTDVNGNLTLNCAAGANGKISVKFDLSSKQCWDGINLTSPDGRKHMFSSVRSNSAGRQVCPQNFYATMVFNIQGEIQFDSQEDMANTWLASDRMNAFDAAPKPGSSSPCRQVSGWYCNGETMHFDLIPAWDWQVFRAFANNCSGFPLTYPGEVILAGNRHECGDGEIGPNTLTTNTRLIVGNTPSPDGSFPTPVISLNPDHTGAKGYYPPASGTSVSGVIFTDRTP